jgi:hypothetical protein
MHHLALAVVFLQAATIRAAAIVMAPFHFARRRLRGVGLRRRGPVRAASLLDSWLDHGVLRPAPGLLSPLSVLFTA